MTANTSASFCAGDSVQVFGVWYDVAGGVYRYGSKYGDRDVIQIYTITITEDPLETNTVNLAHCPGDSVQYNGVWYTGPGTFTDTVPSTTTGCDTIVTIDVDLENLIPNAVSDSYCQGDSVQVYGQWYDTPGVYTDTVPSTTGGCDTLATITITEDPLETSTVNLSHCPGDSVLYNGMWYTGPGTFTDTVPSITSGCDTIVTIDVAEDPLETAATSASFCAGDSIQVFGEWYDTPGVYTDTIPTTTTGCDTIYTITITEDPLELSTVNLSHCPGDSVLYNGIWYIGPGMFTDTVPSVTTGCDTIVTIDVSVESLIPASVSASYCQGDSVQIYGEWYDAPGVYTDTVPSTTGGCDTLATITISEDPLEMLMVGLSHCPDDSVLYNGNWYIGPGTFTDTIASTTNGCDTVVTIDVTVESLIPASVSASYCEGDSVLVYGEWYDMPGVYTDTVPSTTGGCDTLATITISEDPLQMLMVGLSHCPDDSVMYNGIWYIGPGTFTDTIASTTNGCDTVVTIDVTIESLIPAAVSASYCEGDSVLVYGEWYDMPGVYTDTVPSSTGGCDTLATITISEDPLEILMVSLSHCPDDSVLYNGIWYTRPGTFTDTIASITTGCDTIVNIDVTVESLITVAVSESYCEGDSVQVYGEWYDMPGIYTDTVPSTTGGCDTLATITIDVLPLETNNVSLSHCPGDSVQYNGVWYIGPGVFIDTVQSTTGGCDTVATITVTEEGLITDAASAVVCVGDSVLLYGVWYSMAGTYLDTVQSQTGGCDTAVTITIDTAGVYLTCDQVSPDGGSGDGEGSVTIVGGDPDYTISWDGPQSGSTTSTTDGLVLISNLAGGIYNVTVTDANGCFAVCSFEIDSVGCDLVLDSIVVTDASCQGSESGQLEVFVSGGTMPYEYSTDGVNFQSSNIIANLPSGQITVTVRDANGCIVTGTADIGFGQGPDLVVTSTEDPTCQNPNGGSIRVSASNGTMPYSYRIVLPPPPSPPQPNPDFTGLSAGTYTIEVTDAGGCVDSVTVVLSLDEAPDILDVTVTDATCGGTDGVIVVEATGVDPLTYIRTGAPPQSSETFTGVGAGTYVITVEDANGCTADTVVTVSDVGAPDIVDIVTTPTGCGTSTGSAQIMMSGGTQPYQFILTPPSQPQQPPTPDSLFINLGAGVYGITVIDANGCAVDTQFSIMPADGPNISVISITNTSCGLDDGAFEVDTMGGVPPLVMTINSSVTNDLSFDDLEPGFYTFEVTDANDCTASQSIEIEDSEGVDFLSSFTEDPTCGLCNGRIVAESFGGTPPFSYSIVGGGLNQNGGPNNDWDDLCEDTYEVTITDANGCEAFNIYVLVDLPGPEIESVMINPAACSDSNGSLSLNVDGIFPIEYSIDGCMTWQSTPVFTDLPPGPISICVTDQTGCITTLDTVIGDTPGPQIDNVIVMPSGCNVSTGSIEVIASGGTPPIQYSIDCGVTYSPTNTFTNLASGTYCIKIRDFNDCMDSTTVVIGVPQQDTITIDTVICDTTSFTIGGFTFDSPGNYTVQLVGQPPECDTIVDLTLDVISCCIPDTHQFRGYRLSRYSISVRRRRRN